MGFDSRIGKVGMVIQGVGMGIPRWCR